MYAPEEGYVLHTYGREEYARHAVASVLTLRRHDADRPVALYCTANQKAMLEQHGLDTLFRYIEVLPEANCSIVGFKLNLHQFMPFERSLYVDADMVWCRNPDSLWQQLSAYEFTATGLEKADFFFGGPKGLGVAYDFFLDKRRRTMEHFGLTSLPRVQAGMIYSQDRELLKTVCNTAAYFLSRRSETHFRSRLNEGRNEESCEWSMAMAMSRLELPIFPWFQGYNSPQVDFVGGLTEYDPNFERVTCLYYTDRFVYSLRGLMPIRLRDALIGFFSRLPGRGDYLRVTPYVLHFGWLQHKQPFKEFSARTWERLTTKQKQPEPSLAIPVEPALEQ